MKEKSAQRLLVFVPPRSSMAGRSQLASSTVVDYVATGGSTARGQTPIALLPKASSVDVVFDASDVFITTIDPPKLAEGMLRMALPNILEERLLADPGRLRRRGFEQAAKIIRRDNLSKCRRWRRSLR